jgi:hypothetical protein
MGGTTGHRGRSPFPDGMRQAAFGIWFKTERNWQDLPRLLQETFKLDKAPAPRTLRQWAVKDAWAEHADALEGQMDQAGDGEIIEQRKSLIAQMAQVGQEMVNMGMAYLREKGIESSADAIRAVGRGTELMDKQLGWAAYFSELANANEDKLDRELRRFMTGEVLELGAGESKDTGEEDGSEQSPDT